jgi:hypothetical protein
MEVLREISSSCDLIEKREPPQDKEKGQPLKARIQVFGVTATDSEHLTTRSSPCLSREELNHGIDNGDLFKGDTPERKRASLDLIFLPKDDWKATNRDKTLATAMFRFLHIDPAMTYYLISHRSGWCHVANPDGGHSFMIKDYLYMLVWSFHPKTMETRALLAERSDYSTLSSLKTKDGEFRIPGLCKAHLFHPLSLACVGLIDAVFYFDFVIIDESINIGSIENATGQGFWVKVQERRGRKESKPDSQDQTNALVDAQRSIVTIIGVFANLWKSVGIAKSIAETLDNLDTWEAAFSTLNKDVDCLKYHRDCVASFKVAAGLLKLRIKTIEQSGRAIDDRAAAQSSIV